MPHSRRAAQAESLRKRIKIELIKRDLSITVLAEKLGRPRTSVSRAINHGKFPGIVEHVRLELGL